MLSVKSYITSAVILLVNQEGCKHRCEDKKRDTEKTWWSNGYARWMNEEFVKRTRIKHETFDYILGEIHDNLGFFCNRQPTTPDQQLALTIYRLAHACSNSTLVYLFVVAEPTACK